MGLGGWTYSQAAIPSSGGLNAGSPSSGGFGVDDSTRRYPGKWKDHWCMTRHPTKQGDENWEACSAYCKSEHPTKPCVVSAFYGWDERAQECKLNCNCMACDEAPDFESAEGGFR